MIKTAFATHLVFVLLAAAQPAPAQTAAVLQPAINPYLLPDGIVSRSISFENPTGEPGQGGRAANRELGVGRKGAACKPVKAGATQVLCDLRGTGVIRHIWITCKHDPIVLRSLVLRAWWDDQQHPSIECPLGDFMGAAFGKVVPYQSAVHSLGARAGMNFWLPMPFAKAARVTLTNEGKDNLLMLFYQMDYTLGDQHPADVGRLHVAFRRENPTTPKQDFELLPLREGKGRFIGALIGVRKTGSPQWWGEGEMKAYLDGDTRFPTIAGTGSEDYVGLSWGLQPTPFLYHGCVFEQDGFASMYRWHLPDPIYWSKRARVTMQQIGNHQGLHETSDDWSCAAFWYEPVPSAPLPAMPDVEARTRNLPSKETVRASLPPATGAKT